MNRTGTAQPLRGLSNGFGNAQQSQPSNRLGSNRMVNGKPGAAPSNGGGWAFGGSNPMTNSSLQSANRSLGGGNNLSFAQSLSGSTPATPLDLSEFPSLSNNPQNASANQQSMWGGGPTRGIGAPGQRPPAGSISQQSQDDPFSSTSRASAGSREAFRFGGQNGLSSQPPPSGTVDDFPPLNGGANGDIGSGRASAVGGLGGFGAQPAIGSSMQQNRVGNGLLNAVSASNRNADARSPIGSRPMDRRPPGLDGDDKDVSHESMASQTSLPDNSPIGTSNPLGAIGNNGMEVNASEDGPDDTAPAVQDPLAGMPPREKWGLKGLLYMMSNYPDYNALAMGIDPASMGLDPNSKEKLSEMTWPPVGNEPPRKPVPDFKVPECYRVNNVQPFEQKIANFTEETLLWIFYTCPMDKKQVLAAKELHSRGWRWHLKHRIWLTRDNELQPVQVTNAAERGYYMIWDLQNWRRDRRELLIHYADLENTQGI